MIGWTYDAAGNLINNAINQYTYDALNRMSSVRQRGLTTRGINPRAESAKPVQTG